MESFRDKRIAIALLSFIGFILLMSVITILVNPKNKYGDQVEITNLEKYTNGKPTNREKIEFIKHLLVRTINLNLKQKINGDTIKDAQVRDGTFNQSFDKQNNIQSVTFIIDIPSIKQSYTASYRWSSNGNESDSEKVGQYSTQVSCPSIDKLIYGDFNCIDERIKESGVDKYDPVSKIIPYEVKYRYIVKSYTALSRESISLKVEAFVPSWSDRQSTIDIYTKEIKDWLKAKKLNPDKYTLDFIY